jgi:hypothetical protein
LPHAPVPNSRNTNTSDCRGRRLIIVVQNNSPGPGRTTRLQAWAQHEPTVGRDNARRRSRTTASPWSARARRARAHIAATASVCKIGASPGAARLRSGRVTSRGRAAGACTASPRGSGSRCR